MRRKQVDVTGTITVVDRIVAPSTTGDVKLDTQGNKLQPYEYCHYCGKVVEKTSGMYRLNLIHIPGGTYWDSCEEGRVAGVLRIIRLSDIAIAQKFQKSHPPYEEHRPCPKCGNEHRATTYQSGGQSYGYSSHHFIHPYIERLCGRCTFHSYEVPLDFDPETIFPATDDNT